MSHIINIVNFIFELIFGRGPSKRTTKRTIGMMVATVMFCLLIGTNYITFNELYSSTAREIDLKRKMTLFEQNEKALQVCRANYTVLRDVLAGGNLKGIPSYVDLTNPNKPQPAPVPVDTPLVVDRAPTQPRKEHD